jgi:serine/threonine protein kinase/Tol biopolymer transport system component
MPLTIGARVGHYEVTGQIGAGGMGEVYRARDTKLDRDVALKILPDIFVADPERRARFAREAKTLAALNHPNVAQIFGVEESGATSALAMELVDGEDLSERIKRGPIPYDEAIALARQIGQALEAAHDQGIVHRDLKPANIKLRDDGTVKVLDFGLAKALEQQSAIVNQQSGSVENSPTITSPAMTLRGVILGTAAYMAPEQAKGKAVDKRADIWAFGCVLYEMLTGRRAFSGDDVSETLASVLKSDTDWTGVPPQARRLIGKCLEKDPRKRLRDIADAWDLIDDAAIPAPVPARRQFLPWALVCVLLVSTIGLAFVHFTEAPAAPPSARFQIEPPPGHSFDIYMALSSDGRRLAFTTRDASGTIHLWVRDLGSLEARRLPGTEGAWSPFWSPDGKYLAFAVDRTLKKIDVSGGPPQTLGTAEAQVGLGAWNSDGTIIFGTRGLGPVRRIAATGGTPTAITAVDSSRGETFHSFPVFLPDGRHFLYIRQSGDAANQGVYIGDLETAPDLQPTRRLALATMGPLALTQGPGGHQILFIRDATLMALAFDVRTLNVSGEPVPVAERIGSAGSFSFFAASGGDVLAYRTGAPSSATINQLTWIDRKGARLGKIGEPGPFSNNPFGIAISPDARHAAVMWSPTASADLWLLEFARGIRTRFTFSEAPDGSGVWSPEGKRIAFRSSRPGKGTIYVKETAGVTEESLLVPSVFPDRPADWSGDGRLLLFVRGAAAATDLWLASADGRSGPVPLLETPFAETDARFSPDGRWIAYVSNESGEFEVYIRPFAFPSGGRPSVGAHWRVSADGGGQPRWRRDGRELFYRARSGAIMSVDVTFADGQVQTSIPRQLFLPSTAVNLAWDVTPDGQRFLLALPVDQAVNPDPVTVVLNWNVTSDSAQGSRSNRP